MYLIAMQAAMGAANAYLNRGKEKAQELLDRAKVASDNAMREGSNALSAAQAALANHGRTLGNIDRAKGSALKRSALLEQAAKAAEELQAGDLQKRGEAAAVIGAATAALGAAGAAGGSISTIRSTATLQAALSSAAADRAAGRVAGGVAEGVDGIALEEVQGTDLNSTFAAINRMVTQVPIREKSSILGGALQGAASAIAPTAAAGGGGLTGLANATKSDVNALSKFFRGG